MSVTAPQSNRERLKSIREELGELRDQAGKARQAARLAREHGEVNSEAVAQLKLDDLNSQIELKQELEVMILQQFSGIADYREEGFLDNPQLVQQFHDWATSPTPVPVQDFGQLVSRDGLLAMISTGSWRGGIRAAAGDVVVSDAARRGPFFGAVQQARRRLTLLDVIPTRPMDSGNSFDYMIQSGDPAAVETAEGALKPAASVALSDGTVTARTIAGWIKIFQQQLDDMPMLSVILNDWLIYDVMRRVDNQIVAGDGQGMNLRGILNTTGVGEVEFDADVPLSDLVLDGADVVDLSDGEPDAVVIHPQDLSAMRRERTPDGRRLDGSGAFGTDPEALWGLPAVKSKVLPRGTAIVGDFGHGSTLFVRQGVNVKMSDSDQDDFLRNKLTLRGEGRFGLAIWRPTSFSVVHLAAA